MNVLLLLQQTTGTPASEAGTPPVLTQTITDTLPTEAQMNILDLAMKGGWIDRKSTRLNSSHT